MVSLNRLHKSTGALPPTIKYITRRPVVSAPKGDRGSQHWNRDQGSRYKKGHPGRGFMLFLPDEVVGKRLQL